MRPHLGLAQDEHMPAEVARNAPCPCGSGKKYKRCHGAQGSEEPVKKRRFLLPIIVLLISTTVGVVVGLSEGYELGLGTGGGTLILAWIYFALQDPPPPNAGSGDPAGLNFGR